MICILQVTEHVTVLIITEHLTKYHFIHSNYHFDFKYFVWLKAWILLLCLLFFGLLFSGLEIQVVSLMCRFVFDHTMERTRRSFDPFRCHGFNFCLNMWSMNKEEDIKADRSDFIWWNTIICIGLLRTFKSLVRAAGYWVCLLGAHSH